MFKHQLEAVHYQNPPWSLQYPELVHIFQDCRCTMRWLTTPTVVVPSLTSAQTRPNSGWILHVANNSMKCWIDQFIDRTGHRLWSYSTCCCWVMFICLCAICYFPLNHKICIHCENDPWNLSYNTHVSAIR